MKNILKRLLAFSLSLALVLSLSVGLAASEKPAAGRNSQVFDTSKDKGRLVARVLDMNVTNGEKTGDSTVLKSPDGKIMLIDAGIPASAQQVVTALKELGIKKIDYLLASHPHIDHIGGFPSVMDNFEVGEIFMSSLTYDTQSYHDFMASIRGKKTKVTYLKEGDKFKFGEEVSAEVFNPEEKIEYYDGYPDNSTQFVNERSVVVKFTYKDISMLFTGDIYKLREMDLVEKYGDRLKADFLKIPHHGDNTSSTSSFIQAVSPKAAVMTFNAIANLSVVELYKKRNVELYHTNIDGNIMVWTDGKTLNFLTQKDRVTDLLDKK